MNLVYFYNEKFASIASQKQKSLKNQFANIKPFLWEDIKNTLFYKKNISILNSERGCGYWLWKPYILLEICKMHPNEVWLYMDCGDGLKDHCIDHLHNILRGSSLVLAENNFLNSAWTKRDCFYYMDCDYPNFWNARQIEAGTILFKSDDFSKKIFNEWLSWCEDPRILTDTPNECGIPNFANFIDHRHDQSILTNLQIKYNLKKSVDLFNIIQHNKYVP